MENVAITNKNTDQFIKTVGRIIVMLWDFGTV